MNKRENERYEKRISKTVDHLRAAGIVIYRDESSNPLWNAQRNLNGKTHYVDDDTISYFGARVTSSRIFFNGLLFVITESVKHPTYGRVHRFVVFDVFGTVINKRSEDMMFSNRAQAEKAMWTWINAFDAINYTRDAMRKTAARQIRDAKTLLRGAR